jgi:hypothetical protein
MRIRIAALLLVAVALLSGVALAATASARTAKPPKVPCKGGAATHTIAHSAKARLFTDEKTGYYYACLYKNGHPRKISTIEHWEYQLIRFREKYIAFVAFAEASNYYIGVMNLSNGHIREFQDGGEVTPIKPPPSGCPTGVPNCSVVCPQVDSLVLKYNGSLAWIAVNFPAPSPTTGVFCGNEIPPVTEVRRYDSRGLRVIAQGAGIEPASLRLSGGSTLTWVDEGRSVTANLL